MLTHTNDYLKLRQQRRAGYAVPSPFARSQHASAGNSSLHLCRQNLLARAVLSSSALFLPECLPAPLHHTHLAPSPAFLVLAAKSMGVLRRQLNPPGFLTGLLWGNLGQLSYPNCASFLDLTSISRLSTHFSW